MGNPGIILIDNLRQAKEELKRMGVSSEGVKIMAPKAVHHLIKLKGIPLKEAFLIKQGMLSKGGEAALEKDVISFKKKTTDILLMGTLRQYKDVLGSFRKQPFNLPQLGVQIKEVMDNFERGEGYHLSGKRELRCGRATFRLGRRTYIMGVLNLTPDSFSGDGIIDQDAALSQAKRFEQEGADIIDVGGESTRPGAETVPLDEELKRVIPVLKRLVKEIKVPVSIDTYKPEVAEPALKLGASMVNDISGLRGDKRMAKLVAKYDVPVVIMHIKGTPKNMQENPQYLDLLSEIKEYLEKSISRAEKEGVDPQKIIIDPGIGFGKTLEHNLEIIRKLKEFKSLGKPILIGTSRKSLIGKVLNLPVGERLEGTAATVALSISNGADFVRVHDVGEMVRVVRMSDALVRGVS